MKFVVDFMLGKLARWLRLLGYDTIYDRKLSAKELVRLANEEGRIFLTRSKMVVEELGAKNFYVVKAERFREQLKEVIKSLNLDTESNLFSRCSICNVEIVQVDKSELVNKLSKETLDRFDEFYICPSCRRIYWDGSHTARIIKLLNEIKNE